MATNTFEYLPQCPACGKSFVKGRWIKTPKCFKPVPGVKIIAQACHECSAPVPQLEGSFPVVLYFKTNADRQAFLDVAREALPGLVSKKL